MKIFIFINGGAGTDWVSGMALAEDGTYLAGHISSTDGWFRHDMGLTSDWQHEHYREHCPDGYELVEVDDPRTHEGLQAAYKLSQALKRASSSTVAPAKPSSSPPRLFDQGGTKGEEDEAEG